jgi:hypothetical protein
MKFNVADFIGEWEAVRDMTKSHASSRVASELSVLGDERENWEVFACLIGYSQKEEKGLDTILSEIPDIHLDESTWDSVPFLRYSAYYSRSPMQSFIQAVNDIKYRLGGSISLSSESQIEHCLALYSNDPPAFLQCLAEGKSVMGESEE